MVAVADEVDGVPDESDAHALRATAETRARAPMAATFLNFTVFPFEMGIRSRPPEQRPRARTVRVGADPSGTLGPVIDQAPASG
ncbi:hypothetical protein GCM10010988_37310 [Cnuibacter physcomitrellae]|nr:hypothetical protein GCM10010988_37310 [Cnuibacter physcomitrellae]